MSLNAASRKELLSLPLFRESLTHRTTRLEELLVDLKTASMRTFIKLIATTLILDLPQERLRLALSLLGVSIKSDMEIVKTQLMNKDFRVRTTSA